MLNNIKLAKKLVGGFAILILLAVGLGTLAIIKMRDSSARAVTLDKDIVPTVLVANEVERQSLLTMYNIRGYVMSGDKTMLESGRQHLDDVKKKLDEAKELAQARNLEDLSKAATEGKKNVDEYEGLVNDSVASLEVEAKELEVMNQTAQAFMANCYKYLEDQNQRMLSEINASTQSEKLVERLEKINGINDIIDIGNACRIANFKSRAVNDPDFIQKALPKFDELNKKIDEMLKTTRVEANRQQLEEIRKSGADYAVNMRNALEGMAKKKDLAARRQSTADKVLAASEKLTKDGVNSAKTIASETATVLTGANRMLVVGLITVMLIGSAFAYILTRGILKPVNAIVARIRDIAEGEGDLTQRVEVTSHDEIGEMGMWFNKFIEKVHDIISQVTTATAEVASAATQIAASSEEMSAGMHQQTAQTQQVSAAIEEMSSTVVEVARKSADAANEALSAGKQATDGGAVVTQTIHGMEAISAVVNESAQAIAELGKRGEQIGEIIGVINDIADQTNLLALNAAIEAARAGEHGRGFAVVADEVRKLAERTTHATKEVAQSIQAIQHETSVAVDRMSSGTTRVAEGVELARSAGDSLESIVSGAQGVAGMIQSIAAASEQQSAAAEQIARNIESISAVTRESSTGAAQAASAASQLSSRSELLQQLVGRFKI